MIASEVNRSDRYLWLHQTELNGWNEKKPIKFLQTHKKWKNNLFL